MTDLQWFDWKDGIPRYITADGVPQDIPVAIRQKIIQAQKEGMIDIPYIKTLCADLHAAQEALVEVTFTEHEHWEPKGAQDIHCCLCTATRDWRDKHGPTILKALEAVRG